MFAFNRGEVSKAALARVDNERLRLAAECQLNWMPTVIGEMTLRPGLQCVNEVLGDAQGITIPFIFSKFDTAVLELTPSNLRIEIAGTLVSRVAVGTVISDPFFVSGAGWTTAGSTAGTTVQVSGGGCNLIAGPVGSLAQVQQIVSIAVGDRGKEHGLFLNVTNGPVTVRAGTAAGLSDVIASTELDTGVHSLAFTPATGSVYLQIESTDAWSKALTHVAIDGAGVLTLATPWTLPQLESLRWDQSGDIVYCAAYGIQPYKIERRGAHSWSVVLWRPKAGPFSTVSSGSISLTSSNAFGNVTISSNASFFSPGCEQQLIEMFTPGQFNSASLGAAGAFAPAVRIAGVGATRNYNWNVSGTWVGTVSLQRSFDGPTSGFVTVATRTSNGALASTTGGSTSTPDLDNVIAWERVGFEASNYTSGVALVGSTYAGGGSFGLARILAYTSPTQVSAEVISPFGSTFATDNFQISDWSSAKGWPTAVAFFEGRLGWGSGPAMSLSQSDNYTGYASADISGNDLGDAGAIVEIFGSGPVDSVNWLLPLTRLLVGREQSIESVRSSSFDQVLTPATVSTKPCSTRGAARAKAVRLDTSGIYIDESGSRLYKLTFTPQSMDYAASDLTRLNTDIGEPGFVDIAVQRQRDTHIWLPKTDGQAAVLMDEAADEIECWWRAQTLGVIENVCVLPAPSGPENLVFLTVRRVINGVTRRFREQLAPRLNCIGGPINQLFDCHKVYQGAAVSTLQVSWLPNTTVGVWADGAYLGAATSDASGNVSMPDGLTHSNIVVGLLGQVYQAAAAAPSYNPIASVAVPAAYNGFPAEVFADGRRIGVITVSGGAVTLPAGRVAANVTACLGYVAPFMSAKLAYAADGGTAINQYKKIDHVGLLLQNTSPLGLVIGQRMDTLDPMPQIEQDALVPSTVWDQYDQQAQEVPGQWDTDARLCMLGAAPYPVTINGVVISVTTNG